MLVHNIDLLSHQTPLHEHDLYALLTNDNVEYVVMTIGNKATLCRLFL